MTGRPYRGRRRHGEPFGRRRLPAPALLGDAERDLVRRAVREATTRGPKSVAIEGEDLTCVVLPLDGPPGLGAYEVAFQTNTGDLWLIGRGACRLLDTRTTHEVRSRPEWSLSLRPTAPAR